MSKLKPIFKSTKEWEINKGRYFQMYFRMDFIWFRIFGWGLVAKDIEKNGLMFSEKQGLVSCLEIFGWSIKLLKPAAPRR